MRTTTQDLRIRVSDKQKARIINLKDACGFKTISDFCRAKIFNDDLSIHIKLNKIIEKLEGGNDAEQ